MMESANISGRKFRSVFVLILVLATSALFLAVVWPFLKALLVGAILSGLCQPLYRALLRLFRGHRSLASAVTLLILLLLIVGPLSALLGVVVKQALAVSEHAIPWLQDRFGGASAFDASGWLAERFPFLGDFVPSQQEIVNAIGTAARAAGGFLVAGASALTAGTASFLLNFFVMLYAMFFFLKDGRQILDTIFYYMPLGDEEEARMLERFVSVTRATVKGTLLIGFIQGSLAGIAFYFAGIGGSAFWGTIMVILSVVPGIGSALVWVPAVIYLFLIGQPLSATLLGIWCAAVVGTIDNILRPPLVGKDAKMPDLLILIGTLGGLFLFGPIGFIVGPIVCGLFLTTLDIYGSVFRHILPPVEGARPQTVIKPGTGADTPEAAASPASENPAQAPTKP